MEPNYSSTEDTLQNSEIQLKQLSLNETPEDVTRNIIVTGKGIEYFCTYDLPKWRASFLSSGIHYRTSILKGYSLLV